MRIAVIALKNAADARMNTKSVILPSHCNLSRSVITTCRAGLLGRAAASRLVYSLEFQPPFVNGFFCRACPPVALFPCRAAAPLRPSSASCPPLIAFYDRMFHPRPINQISKVE
jgi:hypothetical protein